MMNDREKYIEVLSKAVKTVKEYNEDTPIKISLECIEDILELLKEREAKWIQIDDDSNIWECLACKELQMIIDNTPFANGWKYCPNCGAKMTAEVVPNDSD